MTSCKLDAVVLLLPGMSLNATIFPDLGLPTIAPDLSRISLGQHGVTRELARDGFDVYIRLVEKELGFSGCWDAERRIVVAHSFGGMLALQWLLAARDRKPQRVDGFVIIASTAGPMYERVRLKLPIPWVSRWRPGLGRLVPIWNSPQVTKAVKRILNNGSLGAEPVDFQTLEIKSDRDLGLAGWRNTDWRAMRAFRFVMDGFDVRDRLREITVPTIVLHGTEDWLFGIEDAQLLCREMPNAELRLIESAGHSLPVTHGDEVVRAVQDLLRA